METTKARFGKYSIVHRGPRRYTVVVDGLTIAAFESLMGAAREANRRYDDDHQADRSR